MIAKTELRTSLTEVLDEELDGRLTEKERGELVETLIDRLQQDFDVYDDEDEEEDSEEESEDVEE